GHDATTLPPTVPPNTGNCSPPRTRRAQVERRWEGRNEPARSSARSARSLPPRGALRIDICRHRAVELVPAMIGSSASFPLARLAWHLMTHPTAFLTAFATLASNAAVGGLRDRDEAGVVPAERCPARHVAVDR